MKPQLYNDGLIELRSRLCKLLLLEEDIYPVEVFYNATYDDSYEGGECKGRQDAYNDIIIMIDDMLKE